MRRSRVATLFVAALLPAWAAAASALPQWTNVGPQGGASMVVADPADANHVVLLDRGANVFETRDRGVTWTEGSIPACSSPGANSVGNATIAGGAYYQLCGTAILRTTDGGDSWTSVIPESATKTVQLTSLFFDPSNAATALAYGYNSFLGPVLYNSRDGGKSWWGPYQGAGSTPWPEAFDPTQPGRLVALNTTLQAGQPSMYLTKAWESRDLGGTWQQLGTVDLSTTGIASGSCFGGGFGADRAGRWYMLGGCRLEISADGGRTWSFKSLVDEGLPSYSLAVLRIDPSVAGHIAVSGSSTMLESRDGGVTWTSNPMPGAIATTFDFGADGTVWAASQNGIYRRDPGSQDWLPVSVDALRSALPTRIAIGGADAQALLTNSARSTDGGQSWTAGAVVGITPVVGQPLAFYGFQSDGALLFSDDAGATWKPAGITTETASGDAIGNFAPVGPQPGVIYAFRESYQCGDFDGLCFNVPVELLHSSDGGRTWSSIDAGLAGTGRSIALFASDPAVVYVATSKGAYRSTDAGTHWQLLSTPTPGAVVPDAIDRSTLYQWSAAGLWVSADAGAHWAAGTIPNVRGTSWLLADPAQAGRAYLVAQDGTAFETRDRAASWKQVALGAQLQFQPYAPPIVAAAGDERILAGVTNNSAYAVRFSGDALILDTDLWWDPAQSGWGVSIAQHASGNLFVVWYRYDAQGRATWSVLPGGRWLDSRTFTGTLYTTTGPSYFTYTGFDSTQVHATPVGEATLVFQDADSADVAFPTAEGPSFRHHVVRQRFGTPRQFAGPNVSDLWWNPAQSGWGIVLSQQFGTVFGTWFVYDEQGRPTWLTIPAMQLTQQPFAGDLYTATGPPSTGAFDASKVVATKAGSVFVTPSARGLTMGVTAFGQSRSVSLSRQPF